MSRHWHFNTLLNLVGYWWLMSVNLSWNTYGMVLLLIKPSWLLMVNVCKPFMKHIWYGVAFNSKHEYRLVKSDFVNIENFQLLNFFSCSSDSIIIWNILKLSWRPLAFISYNAFLKNKKRSGISLSVSFFAWFLKKKYFLDTFY